jgi:c-di-GMP-binding flagellar brake protein YcgR
LDTRDPRAVAEKLRRDLERRRRHRTDITLDLEIERAAAATPSAARLRNVGLDGARIDTEVELSNGESIDLILPEGEGHPALKLSAKVIWILAEPEEDRWPVGVEFAPLEEATRQKLLDYVVSWITGVTAR